MQTACTEAIAAKLMNVSGYMTLTSRKYKSCSIFWSFLGVLAVKDGLDRTRSTLGYSNWGVKS